MTQKVHGAKRFGITAVNVIPAIDTFDVMA